MLSDTIVLDYFAMNLSHPKATIGFYIMYNDMPSAANTLTPSFATSIIQRTGVKIGVEHTTKILFEHAFFSKFIIIWLESGIKIIEVIL